MLICKTLQALTLAAAVGVAMIAPQMSTALAADALPPLGVAADQTSVSGLSSGAYMAGQIQVAHSKDIVGAGLVAGGPHGCAETETSHWLPFWPLVIGQNTAQALNACMKTEWGVPDADDRVERAKELAAEDEIDPLSGLGSDKVYLHSGKQDATVTRPVVEAAKAFYEKAGVPNANIAYVQGEGGHAFLTETEGGACGVTEEPFISDCDYGQAKAILSWIYGDMDAPATAPTGQFLVFDQSDLAEPGDGFADEGVLYVPEACASQAGCRLHIVLHGCEQSREAIGDDFVRKSGFAELADTNRLVLLFPQIEASTINPKGCWDWWGYTGLDYLGKDAPQIAAIWGMVERLQKAPGG
jgi:poly(3-hydroxybutyrate) depolymerase